MDKEIEKFIHGIFLFDNLPDEDAARIASTVNFERKEFEKNICIFSPFDYEKKVGFVIDGECEVRRFHSDGGFTPISTIGKYGSFGIITIFSSFEQYPTHVYTKKKTKVIFIDESTIVNLTRCYPDIAINIIKFLTDRISFLNSKVSTFTSGSVEQKLASYLLSTATRLGSCEFLFNRKRSAEILNTGRASLYRAIDSLSAEGIIKCDNKKIYILDREGLERISK